MSLKGQIPAIALILLVGTPTFGYSDTLGSTRNSNVVAAENHDMHGSGIAVSSQKKKKSQNNAKQNNAKNSNSGTGNCPPEHKAAGHC
ncbi:MAG: hypothetical protein K2Y27_01610 [Xanthobacteraceae bacterium]|nr:hypothetical protein [Xanthobacteraceae bacterium]